MIKILDSKNSNYLSKLRLILEKRRLGSKINTDNVIKIVWYTLTCVRLRVKLLAEQE